MNTKELSKELASKYMLVRITIRRWSGSTSDKDLAGMLEHDTGARPGALRTLKHLLAGADSELRSLNKEMSNLRDWFYSQTLPFSTARDGALKGERLLASTEVMGFLKEFARRRDTIKEKLQVFLSVYDARVAQAVKNLGDAAKEEDYPSRDKMARLFGVHMDFQPMPDISAFGSMTSIPANLATSLAQRVESQMAVAVDNAKRDMVERLVEQLGRMVDVLGKKSKGKKTRINDSLVEGLQHLVQLARSNADIVGDDVLERVEEVALRLGHLSADELRKGGKVVEAAAAEAATLKADLDGVLDNLFY